MNPLLISSLLTALLQSSLLVTGAWLLILTQRRSSAARRSTACRITMAAALVLVAVTIGNTAFSLIPDSKPSIAIAPATLPQGAGTMTEDTLLIPVENPALEKLQSLSLPAVSSKKTQSNSPWMLPAAPARWLAAAWLTGATVVLTAWFSSLAARLTLLRRSQNTARVPWLEIAREVKGWHLLHQVRLIPHEITPCVWGVRKSILVLPASASEWPAAKLKMVLAHECAHLLRRDPLWQLLSRFFLALLWFHPLAWSLACRSRAADEQAADDIVLKEAGDAPSYAALLVECARQFSLPPALQTTASAMATPTTLTRRVEAVLDPATDRRPASSAGLFTWAVLVALLTVVSMQAAPEISTKQDQHSEVVKTDADIPGTETQPVVPPTAETPKPDFKVSADTVIFPPEKPADRKTYIFKGSVTLRAYEISISADEVKADWKAGQNPAAPTKVIDPGNLTSVVASGSVVVEGKFAGSTFSGKADSAVYTPNQPGQGLILTGWPWLKTFNKLIEGMSPDSRIIFEPDGTSHCEQCTSTTYLDRYETPQTTAPPNETPDTSLKKKPPTESFAWKPVSLNGLDYLPGQQVKDFYRFSNLFITVPGAGFEFKAWKMNLKGAMGSNVILVNRVRFFLKHPVLSSGGMPMISRQDLSLRLDPVIRPSLNEAFRTVTTVVIDPGHGGIDTGSTGPQGTEAAFTLDTALRLKALLETSGLKVVLTRQDDSRVKLDQRAVIAAAEENALLISLHFSQDKDPSKQGLRTFFPDGDTLGTDAPDYLKASIQLAVAVHANCLSKLRPSDGGVQEANFSALRRQTKTPAILMECGYLSHSEEGARIATGDYRQTLAASIAGGVQNYLQARSKSTRVSR